MNSKEELKTLKDFVDFEPDSPKYILDLTKFKNADDFLMTLTKNRRHDLRKDKRRIERQNPEIVIDNFSDLKNLIRLSKERFRQRGDPSALLRSPRGRRSRTRQVPRTRHAHAPRPHPRALLESGFSRLAPKSALETESVSHRRFLYHGRHGYRGRNRPRTLHQR